MDASPFQVSCIDSILRHNPSINSHGTKLLSPRPCNSEAFSCCGCVLPWGNHWAVSPDRDISTQLQHYITPAFCSSCFKPSLDQLVFPFPLNGTREADTPRPNSAMCVFCSCIQKLGTLTLPAVFKIQPVTLISSTHSERYTEIVADAAMVGIEYYKPLLQCLKVQACLVSSELKKQINRWIACQSEITAAYCPPAAHC